MEKDQLLKYCYENKEKFLENVVEEEIDGGELFEYLIVLVEEETLTSKEHLSAYGMDY